MYRLSKIINGKAIIISENIHVHIFCFNVIDFFSKKLSKYYLYILLDLKHASNLLDPLAKQYDVKIKNGTVGNTGNATPIVPNKRDIQPTITYIVFLTLFIKLSYFLICILYTHFIFKITFNF